MRSRQRSCRGAGTEPVSPERARLDDVLDSRVVRRVVRHSRTFRASALINAILASALLALGGCGDSPDGPVVVDEPPDPVQLRLAGAGPLADTDRKSVV